MKRIILFMKHKENLRLLSEWLSKKYDVATANSVEALDGEFDLGILDGVALEQYWEDIQARREKEDESFLPFLLIVSRQDVDLVTHHLWKTVDELITTPIQKIELQARVEVLLRERRLWLKLKRLNEDLETFIHSTVHDLKTPLGSIRLFTKMLLSCLEDELDEQNLHYLKQIEIVNREMYDSVENLLDFLRLGRENVEIKKVNFHSVVEECLSEMEEEIKAKEAQVTVKERFPEVKADPILLKIIPQNLISNALKYVDNDVKPQVNIYATKRDKYCRIHFKDNGIGIPPDDQKEVFKPFVRLHSDEVYSGTGLGLSSVSKVVEIMNGKIGVESEPGKGSRFWIELEMA